MEHLLERIETFINQLHANPSIIARADIDELCLLVEAHQDKLPKRFLTITENLDKHFTANNPEWAWEYLDRLKRVLLVTSSLPKPMKQIIQDELLPTFTLPHNDKNRVLELCSQMRKIVLATEVFDQPHRRRLLNRIAGIEQQVEQPKGLLDVVRAGVSDVGETLGKFGTDIKPLTDRMKEVALITRSNSKEYDQIPAPDEVKRLPAPEENEPE